jgi:hypothetical protein
VSNRFHNREENAMSGHAGGPSETVKSPSHPEIPNDELVPAADADQQGGVDPRATAGEGAHENQEPDTSTGARR